VLTAVGVPNDFGQPRWPIGLQILATKGADELREQLEALFQVAAVQSTNGPVNPELAQEMGRAVRKFRRMLLKDKTERFGMPRPVYEEAERFLTKLERAEKILRGDLGGSQGGTQLRTDAPKAAPDPQSPKQEDANDRK
jgi:hypothetical protein